MSAPTESFVAVVLGVCTAAALVCLSLALLQKPASRVELQAKELVRVRSGQEVLVMIEKDGRRRLPVPVSRAEASRIERALNGGPHGLANASIEALGGRVLHATIDELSRERGFRGHLALGSGLREVRLEAPAGEALALALEAGAPIAADEDVLDEAGISLDDLSGLRAHAVQSSSEPAPVLGI